MEIYPTTVEPPLMDNHYTGQNVTVQIEFALRVILYSSLKCGHFAIP